MSYGEEVRAELAVDQAYKEFLLSEGLWVTREGDTIPIKEMTDNHLINTHKMLGKILAKFPKSYSAESYREYTAHELRRRKLESD